MLTGALSYQAVLETKGGSTVGLNAIFVGAVPVMIGTVLAPISDPLIPLAIWITGISPVTMPLYASSTVLGFGELPIAAARAVPRAFYFWLFVSVLTTLWLIVRLRASRAAMARSISAGNIPPLPAECA
jgi:hypothetical protein